MKTPVPGLHGDAASQDDQRHEYDEGSAARGVIIGLVLSLLIWGLIGLVVFLARHAS